MDEQQQFTREVIARWHKRGVGVSQDVAAHEAFLRSFRPTGDPENDMASFLEGVGLEDIAAFYRDHHVSLLNLAREIRSNHILELENLRDGKPLSWSPRDVRWSTEQKAVYQQLLELENHALDAILDESQVLDSAA